MTNCACSEHLLRCSCPLRLNELDGTIRNRIIRFPQTQRNIEPNRGEIINESKPHKNLLTMASSRLEAHLRRSEANILSENASNINNLVNEPHRGILDDDSPSTTNRLVVQHHRRLRHKNHDHCYSSNYHHINYKTLSLFMFAVGFYQICSLISLTNGQSDSSSYLYSASNAPSSAIVSPNLSASFSQNQPIVVANGPSLCPLVPACQCKWSNGKQGASCEKRNLGTIPSQLPQDTQVLEMNGNQLNQLTQHIFQSKHLTNLQKIFLSDCKLTFIADQAFTHLTNLIELDLSHNFLKQAPIKSFEQLNHSLRKLSLSHNPIQTIEPETFSSLTQLNTLDLTSCQLSQLKPGAFQGLSQLKELRLPDNRLTQLPMSVLSDLTTQYLSMELFNNPWHCDCELKQSIEWMSRNHVQISIGPSCAAPAKHKDVRWISVRQDDFLCPPTVINKQNELVVGAGSNVSLACQARGSPPLTFVWFQDEKNLTTTYSNTSEQPASTKLLEERRYEIAEELGPNITTSLLYLYDLQLSDTSLFLCWVENGAGYSHANFSLIVNDSPPAQLKGAVGSGADDSMWRFIGLNSSEAQLGIVSIAFVVLLAAAIMFLLMFKHSGRSSKSSQSDDIKQSKPPTISGPRMATIGTISGVAANEKFAINGGQHHQRSMLAEGDDYGDSDDDQSSENSSASCRKNGQSNYDGFIEHMRTGIINIDYHSMSPVGQFNNSIKNRNTPIAQQHQQTLQQVNQRFIPNNHIQQQTHLGNNQHPMHHFPSASNASSVPPYYGSGNGSASMATTTSDLSPGSGSGDTNFANNNGPTTNCDLQHQFNEMTSPPTNTTTTSYTSDYQSNYGAGTHLDDLPESNSMPPMYYDTGAADGHLAGYHPAMYTGANGQLMIPAGAGMLHGQHTNSVQGVLQDRLMAQRMMANQQHQQQQQPLRLDPSYRYL